MIEHELPFCPQSPNDGPRNRFTPGHSTPHKGSKSKSSQATTSKDNSAVLEDQAVNITDLNGSTVTVETLAPEVVADVLDFAGDAGGSAIDIVGDALDFAANSDSRTANVINSATEGVKQLSEKVVGALVADKADARQGAENEILNTLGKYSTAIVIAGAAGIYFYSRKK